MRYKAFFAKLANIPHPDSFSSHCTWLSHEDVDEERRCPRTTLHPPPPSQTSTASIVGCRWSSSWVVVVDVAEQKGVLRHWGWASSVMGGHGARQHSPRARLSHPAPCQHAVSIVGHLRRVPIHPPSPVILVCVLVLACIIGGGGGGEGG